MATRQRLIFDIINGKNTLDPELKKSAKSSSQLSKSIVSFGKSFAKVALSAAAVGAALAAAAVAFSVKNAIKEAIKLENALTGLRSVASAFGQDVDKIEQAAKDLAEDGLIPLSDVSASLKNLFAAGLDANKAIETFKALRNTAAFGRQGQLELGEAIRGATEGLKNLNSVTLDNAGVSTNASIFIKQYAASIGKAVSELSEYEKRLAVANGLIREGRINTGDYDKLLNTFSGALAAITGRWKALDAEFGNLIIKHPLVIGFLREVANLIKVFGENSKKNNERVTNFITTVVTGFTKAIPLTVGFFKTSVETIREWSRTLGTASVAVLGFVESFVSFEFVQKILKISGKAFATFSNLVFTSIRGLISVIESTSIGKSLLSKLGLDPEELDKGLVAVQSKLNDFGQNINTSEFLASIDGIKERLKGAFIIGDEGFESAQETLAQLEALAQGFSDRVLTIEKNTAKERQKIRTNDNKKTVEGFSSVNKEFIKQLVGIGKFDKVTKQQQVSNTRDSLAQISTLQRSKSKELFLIGKAGALAQALVDGSSAVIKALNTPFPLSTILPPLVAASVAANVATIASAKPPAFQQGGFIPNTGAPTTGDNVLAAVNPGEAVLNRDQQQEFLDIANGRRPTERDGEGQVIDIRVELDGMELGRALRNLNDRGIRTA